MLLANTSTLLSRPRLAFMPTRRSEIPSKGARARRSARLLARMSPPAYSLLGNQAEQLHSDKGSSCLGMNTSLREWEEDERGRADAGIRLRRLLAAMGHRKVLS